MTADPLEIMKTHFRPKDTVIAAVSGGPDSVFLLHKCIELSAEIPVKIIVAHVNHRLRGHDSNADATFVETLAKKNNLTFELKNLKKITKGNLEEQCRNRRYTFFEELRQKYHGRFILTAHHLNDNIETVLFNLVRGSFFGGIRGMKTVCEERHLLRPLLGLTRAEIMKQLKKNKLKFSIDKTNSNTKLARNMIRHKVVPLLKKINPGFETLFAKNIRNFRETAEYLETEAEKWLKKKSAGGIKSRGTAVNLKNFLKLPRIMQQVVVARIYKNTYGNTVKFNGPHLRQILAMLERRQTGLKKEFGQTNFMIITKHPEQKEHFIVIGPRSARPVEKKPKTVTM